MTDNLLENTVDDLDENKDYLEELVGEGKKFKTPQELARGKYEADNYIKFKNQQFDELKSDFLRMKEEANTRAKLEDLIDQINLKQLASNDLPKVNEDAKPVYDPKEIESLVSSKLQEFDASKREDANFNSVRDKLKERFGNNYKSILREQIETLGLTEAEVNEMARKRPQVLLRALGADDNRQRENFQAPLHSNQRSEFAPRTQKRTWSFYQDMKAKDHRQYLDPKTQLQMQEDMISLGEAFKDGDYNAFD